MAAKQSLPAVHIKLAGPCNDPDRIAPRDANIATSQKPYGTPTVAIAEATLRSA
jgi:hypothetical protein